MKHLAILLFLAGLLLPAAPRVTAAEDGHSAEIDRIARLGMDELTAEAARALAAKYPEEDWSAYRFPRYVYTNPSVTVAYRIAAREPVLLAGIESPGGSGGIPCYCFCESLGHENLLDCFWKEGKAGGEFDDHAAACSICYGQAMLAFLWAEAGASDAEIRAAMAEKFGDLVEKHGR